MKRRRRRINDKKRMWVAILYNGGEEVDDCHCGR
jgi:hypothetical protein